MTFEEMEHYADEGYKQIRPSRGMCFRRHDGKFYDRPEKIDDIASGCIVGAIILGANLLEKCKDPTRDYGVDRMLGLPKESSLGIVDGFDDTYCRECLGPDYMKGYEFGKRMAKKYLPSTAGV